MALNETLLPEFGNELATTRRVFEFVPWRILGFAFRVPCLALLSLSIAFPAAAAPPQLPPLVERALEAMERSDQDGYAFRTAKTEDGSTEIVTFDPAKPEGQKWNLIQKNGKNPSARELDDFRKELARKETGNNKEKKDKSKNGDKGDQGLREMIAPESLQLISETGDRASYRFRLKIDDEDAKAFADAIRGTLNISKAAPHVESLDLASTGEIRVMAGVKLSEFHLTLTFLPPDAHGQALPATIRSVVKGRAMLVKKLDQNLTVKFSDYERRAPSVTQAR